MTPDFVIEYLSSLCHQTFSFVSSSHRVVYRGDTDNAYYKFSLYLRWSVAIEHDVFNALYGSALIIETPYGPVLKTPNMGEVVNTSWDSNDYAKIAETLTQVHQLKVLTVPRLQPRLYQDMLAFRVYANQELSAKSKTWLADNMYGAMEHIPELGANTLVHSDAHKQNWVVNKQGVFSLIDWESARLACPEVDYASIIHSAVILQDELPDFSYLSLDIERLRYALALKAMSACCFWAWKHGETALQERVELLENTIIPMYDLQISSADILDK